MKRGGERKRQTDRQTERRRKRADLEESVGDQRGQPAVGNVGVELRVKQNVRRLEVLEDNRRGTGLMKISENI